MARLSKARIATEAIARQQVPPSQLMAQRELVGPLSPQTCPFSPGAQSMSLSMLKVPSPTKILCWRNCVAGQRHTFGPKPTPPSAPCASRFGQDPCV
jgi:hypothetical protein